MDPDIAKFISHQKIASICCIDEDQHPYCFSCYYAEDIPNGLLVFKSSPSSMHIQYLLQCPFVSGTIMPEKNTAFATKGLQFKGEFSEITTGLHKTYYRKFPAAFSIPGEIYSIKLNWIKLTEKSVLQSKKTIWNSPAIPVQP